MAGEEKTSEGPRGAEALTRLVEAAQGRAGRRNPPVHAWNPPYCGNIDMRIAADGRWFYLGSVIARPALVRLFASILRRDPEGFMLVTPVEKVGIIVDDAPFIAVDMAAQAGRIVFRTNVDDVITLNDPAEFRIATSPDGGFKPYVQVRAGLEALLSRHLAQDLVRLAEEFSHPEGMSLGIPLERGVLVLGAER